MVMSSKCQARRLKIKTWSTYCKNLMVLKTISDYWLEWKIWFHKVWLRIAMRNLMILWSSRLRIEIWNSHSYGCVAMGNFMVSKSFRLRSLMLNVIISWSYRFQWQTKRFWKISGYCSMKSGGLKKFQV